MSRAAPPWRGVIFTKAGEAMDLYYCRTRDGNFGDDMNAWFWDAMIPDRAALAPDVTLVGIGTIISRRHLAGKPRVVIAGSGTGYGVADPLDRDGVDVAWVRGPRTAAALGLPAAAAITDPAAAVVRLGLFESRPKTGRRLFIPHRITAGLALDWDRIGRDAGLEVVSPKLDAHAVIQAIADADLVVTESMHGAILADAFRTPWIAVAVSHHFNEFKWGDWAESVEAPLRLHRALEEAKGVYFGFRRAMRAAKDLFSRRPAQPGAKRSAAAVDFSNPDFMQDDERRFVKRVVATLHGPIERMLVRDLRRAAAAEPTLSPDAALASRLDRIFEATDGIRRRYAA
jgi:succinoglycan biosynthesis protein ExoV